METFEWTCNVEWPIDQAGEILESPDAFELLCPPVNGVPLFSDVTPIMKDCSRGDAS